MIDVNQALTFLDDTKAAIEEAQTSGTDIDTGVVMAKVAANLASLSASALPQIIIPDTSVSDPLTPIKHIMGDLQEGEKYFSKVQGFLEKAEAITTDQDFIKLVMDELIDPNWSLNVDITSDGKSISLVNGAEVINLGKSLLSGDTLTTQMAITAMVTKFEREIFGFSVIETVKSLDSISEALVAANTSDLKVESLLTGVDTLVSKMGGPRLTPMIREILRMITKLNSKRLESKKILEDAVKEFEEAKEKLITEGAPPEETTTTTLAPETPEEEEENIPVESFPPPITMVSSRGESKVPSSVPEEEAEIVESAIEFLSDAGSVDEDYYSG
jgi:hypothetical protein